MKKSLGQHFLINPKINELIVKSADIKADDLVVEIGPGSGLLTDHILKTGARVIAIEKDAEFVKKLKEKYVGQNIEIIEDDVLNFKPLNFKLLNFKLVGNLPYYLTSHLLRVVLTTWPQPEVMVFMLQKEVAQRILAKPPEMNMLAVLVQLCMEPKLVAYVKRGNFKPMPKVDTAIIRLSPSNLPLTGKGEAKERDRVLAIAAKGFAHPRKKLANNLSQELLKKTAIDPSRRAETLTIEEWKSLANI